MGLGRNSLCVRLGMIRTGVGNKTLIHSFTYIDIDIYVAFFCSRVSFGDCSHFVPLGPVYLLDDDHGCILWESTNV